MVELLEIKGVIAIAWSLKTLYVPPIKKSHTSRRKYGTEKTFFCGATQIDESHPLNPHNHAVRVGNGRAPSTATDEKTFRVRLPSQVHWEFAQLPQSQHLRLSVSGVETLTYSCSSVCLFMK